MREEYISRINRVIDHISSNLDSELRLDQLALVANFSPFHFHRIFKSMTGETLFQFIQRIRLEKAAQQLISNPRKTITEIAFDCGFSSSATFARAFKEAFSQSASQWRTSRRCDAADFQGINSKNRKLIRKQSQATLQFSYYIDNSTRTQTWRIETMDKKQLKIEVKEMPEYEVAYVRHIGPYKGDAALFKGMFTKLMTWAGPRGLLRFPETKTLSVYHDDPKLTDESKLRTDACITVPPGTEVDGEIGSMKVPGGKFVVAHFELNVDEYEEAWGIVCGEWLPDSGYQPDDRLCYEICLNNPAEHPEGKHIVDICVPIRPL